MRPNLGWPMILTRSLSVGAVVAWATTAAWGQLSNPNPNRPEPTPAPTNNTPTSSPVRTSAPTADPATQAGEAVPGRGVPGQAGHASDASGTSAQEATGTGSVLGAAF